MLKSFVSFFAGLLVALTGAGGAQAAPLPAHEWTAPAGPVKGVVLVIHGGGWVGVGAQDLRLEDEDVARYHRLGWATLNVDYRPGAAAIIDVVRFYDIARKRVGARVPICSSGRSAGGHLAMLLAVYRPKLACVISQEGPARLLPLLHGHTIPSLHTVVASSFGYQGVVAMSPARHLRHYQGRILATWSPDDQIIPGRRQLIGLRRMAPHVQAVEVRGTPEKGAGQATWVHIDAPPSALVAFHRAERRLLARTARAGVRRSRCQCRGARAPRR